jgi:hypothetical protein
MVLQGAFRYQLRTVAYVLAPTATRRVQINL